MDLLEEVSSVMLTISNVLDMNLMNDNTPNISINCMKSKIVPPKTYIPDTSSMAQHESLQQSHSLIAN